jgi:hypothetical protein
MLNRTFQLTVVDFDFTMVNKRRMTIHAKLWIVKKCRRRLQDEKRRAISRDYVLPFFVCAAVEAMRRTRQPWLIRNLADETGRAARLAGISSAHSNPLEP